MSIERIQKVEGSVNQGYDSVIVVKPESGLPNSDHFVGISAETTGSRGISMSLVIIPPNGLADPHEHVGTESAIYVISGRVLTKYGPNLEFSAESGPGDFVFIPPSVRHQPINLSSTEQAIAITARNSAVDETVLHYTPEPQE